MAEFRLRQAVPWWLRIGAKIVLARLPVGYGFWKRMHLFEHGDMNQPQRALEVVLMHARSAGVLLEQQDAKRFNNTTGDFQVLEIGPGDALFAGPIAKALGASHTWLVDAGRFATSDVRAYQALADYLTNQGFDPPFARTPVSLDDVLAQTGSSYLTSGVASLSRIPAASIDFCFSNAVLEHVPLGDFSSLAGELHRVLKPGGRCLHRVDLKDHLGGALNNLRFSSRSWESPLFSKSGFYTNRLRFREMIGILGNAGFECTLPRVVRWQALPTARSKMAEPFRQLPEDDLLVSGFDVVLQRRDAMA